MSRPQLFNELQLGIRSGLSYRMTQTSDHVGNVEISPLDIERCHRFSVNTLALDSVEGKFMLSGNSSGQLYIHDTEQNERGMMKVVSTVNEHHRSRHRYSVQTVQWFPTDTGAFTSSGMDGVFKVWDTNRLKAFFQPKFKDKIYNHHMNTLNGSLVIVANEQTSAILVDLTSGAKSHLLNGAHTRSIYQCRWSPTCEHLCATGGGDGVCALWDIRYNGGYLAKFDTHSNSVTRANHRRAHTGSVMSMDFTPDGTQLVTLGSDAVVRVWDVALVKNLNVNFGKVPCQNKRTLQMALVTDASPPLIFVPTEKSIALYNMESGRLLKRLKVHLDSVNAVRYCPFSKRVYSAGSDRNILMWEKDYQEDLDNGTTAGTAGDAWTDDEDFDL